jgi:GNAT superfamily N-acetyltransferase
MLRERIVPVATAAFDGTTAEFWAQHWSDGELDRLDVLHVAVDETGTPVGWVSGRRADWGGRRVLYAASAGVAPDIQGGGVSAALWRRARRRCLRRHRPHRPDRVVAQQPVHRPPSVREELPCEELSCTPPGDVRVEQREDPRIVAATDAIIHLPATCICGSDLWPYGGIEAVDGPAPIGHEYVGVVQEVGAEVRNLRAGQFVIGSFFASDNTCEICRAGYQTFCVAASPPAPAAPRPN